MITLSVSKFVRTLCTPLVAIGLSENLLQHMNHESITNIYIIILFVNMIMSNMMMQSKISRQPNCKYSYSLTWRGVIGFAK